MFLHCKVCTFLYQSISSGLLIVLILLYLTAAFVSISHHFLLYRRDISIIHHPLTWFTSHLSDQTHFIQFKSQSLTLVYPRVQY